MESKLTSLAKRLNKHQFNLLSQKSIEWLRNRISNIRNPSVYSAQINSETKRHKSKNELVKGGLYFFYYNPKYANELPYYDQFPLVLVLDIYPDGILGLNIHYLPIIMRAAFLDKLLPLAQMNRNHQPERIRVTYDILNATNKYKEFRPCVKKYLVSHMNSFFLEVLPTEWETSLFLPVQQFRKKTSSQVWKESIESIKGK